ncbi:MAG: helix-turn-helix domain-containing protein [Candidatus Acidiferrum sp.]
MEELKTIGLSESALQKLVSFVLGFRPGQMEDGLRIRLPGASQEDLARMIGLSRETTSRLLSRLKAGKILYWTHSTGVIQNLPALEKMAEAGIGQMPEERYKVAAGVF